MRTCGSLLPWVVLAVVAISAAPSGSEAADRPTDVVYILADDK